MRDYPRKGSIVAWMGHSIAHDLNATIGSVHGVRESHQILDILLIHLEKDPLGASIFFDVDDQIDSIIDRWLFILRNENLSEGTVVDIW